MSDVSPEDLSLTVRTALPEGFAFLLAEYPRPVWEGHPNNGQWCQFWLQRHQMFRDYSVALTDACEQLADGKIEAAAFHEWFVPRVNFYFGEIDTHHKVEEYHYFPALAQAEAQMARGIELLEGDHRVVHDRLMAAHGAVVALDGAIRETPADIASAAPAARDGIAALGSGLGRHLEDEEDIIVPLILDRSEPVLGIG
ncbi:MAG: hemerythrin domain-containing protein [Alphaproteobacteria bacterium]